MRSAETNLGETNLGENPHAAALKAHTEADAAYKKAAADKEEADRDTANHFRARKGDALKARQDADAKAKAAAVEEEKARKNMEDTKMKMLVADHQKMQAESAATKDKAKALEPQVVATEKKREAAELKAAEAQSSDAVGRLNAKLAQAGSSAAARQAQLEKLAVDAGVEVEDVQANRREDSVIKVERARAKAQAEAARVVTEVARQNEEMLVGGGEIERVKTGIKNEASALELAEMLAKKAAAQM